MVTTPVKKAHSAKHVLGAVLSARLYGEQCPRALCRPNPQIPHPGLPPCGLPPPIPHPKVDSLQKTLGFPLNPNPSPQFLPLPLNQPCQGTMGPTSATTLLWCGFGPSLPASVAPCRLWHACWCGDIIWCVWCDVFFFYWGVGSL